jgi:ATP phosphoribosyltransferase
VKPGVLRYRTTVAGLDVSIFLMKAPDVARLLRSNLLDLGLTGDEWLMETGAPADRRCFEVRSYQASVCLLMAEDDPRPPWCIRSVVTPYPNLARSLLQETAPDSEIMAVSGSSEALVPDIADACIDVVETGTSAALNSLVIRKSFEHVTTHLARSEECDPLVVAPIVDLLADTKELVR